MEDIVRNVTLAREYAMVNNYETASIMMADMAQELSKLVKTCQVPTRPCPCPFPKPTHCMHRGVVVTCPPFPNLLQAPPHFFPAPCTPP